MEIGWQVALLAGVGVMGKGLDSCGSRCNNTYTFNVAGKTLGTHAGIMIIGQITPARVSQGMTYHTVSRFYRSSMPMTLNAISVPRIIM
jgi:hypothetical protein